MSTFPEYPIALYAPEAPLRTKPTNYPQPFAQIVRGREKRSLGDLFGLSNFGVNLTRLIPGASSALLHAHSTQDEFIFILEGSVTLVTDRGQVELTPWMCAGFKAGSWHSHHLVNHSDRDVVYLEIGDRSPGDVVVYPEDDLQAILSDQGKWQFCHKDGSPY